MKAPLHDEAHWLLARADALTEGAASADYLVSGCEIAGDWPDLIEALFEFAAEQGIRLPGLDEFPQVA